MSNIRELEDLINDCKSGVFNYTDNGKCIECGNCCSRYLAMNQKEINTIKAYIKRHGIEQQKHSVFVLSKAVFDATCPFLDDSKPNHKCTIYPVRPLICREFKCDKWHEIDRINKLYKANLHPVDVTEIFFPQMPPEVKDILDKAEEAKKFGLI